MTFDPAWEFAHSQHAWARWPNTRFVEFAMRTFGKTEPRSGVRFLELGCGGGAQVAFLADEGFNVVGIDGSTTAIVKSAGLVARRTAHVKQPDGGMIWAQVFVWDLVAAKWEPEQFDCIYDVCTLQHLSLTEAAQVLGKVRGWLRPTGVFWSMMAREIDPLPPDIPAPRLMRSADQVRMLFGDQWARIDVGEETVHLAHRTVRHWIVEARPRSD